MIKKIKYYKNLLEKALYSVQKIHHMQQEEHIIKLQAQHKNPKSLIPHGYKIYSQNDEDGILNEIFKRIGTTNKTFVEFGIGSGLENNTLALIFNGWNGLWIDASSKSIANIKRHFSTIIRDGQLKVENTFITRDNINGIIETHLDRQEIDLLSVDVDGNDFHILHAITCIKPRVIVIEYNAKFRPPISCCMAYTETHTWDWDDCMGASLSFLELQLKKKGYVLVGCNLSGANAFFVQEDLVKDKFMDPYTAETHYQPARFYLSSFYGGHKVSYITVEKFLKT